MSAPTRKRRWLTICAITASAALVAIPAGAAPGANGSPFGARTLAQLAAERAQSVGAITPKAKAQDDGGGDDDNEADEIAEGADQYAEARTSPGVVAPGAYGAAWTSLTNLPSTGGSWHNITNLPYNSDDSRYRDYDSNSSGGSGNVTGRMAAMAADDDGYVYAGSAGAEPPEALALLSAGDADLALVFSYDGSGPAPGLSWRPLGDEPVALVLAADHPAAERRRLSLADLAGEPWIVGCERCRAHAMEVCAAAGFVPSVRHVSDDYVVVQNLVAVGLGVHAAPALGARRLSSPRGARAGAPVVRHPDLRDRPPRGRRPGPGHRGAGARAGGCVVWGGTCSWRGCRHHHPRREMRT